MLKRILVITAVSLTAFYVGDDLSVRLRIPHNRDPFGTVTIKRFYAVKLKDRRTEFYKLDPETRQCVHSVFPHFGYSPCWYLSRKTEERIDM